MLRPTKRQRVECPPSWLDCASLRTVPEAVVAVAATTTTTTRRLASAASTLPPVEDVEEAARQTPAPAKTPQPSDGMIRTPLASATTLEIFLDRFRKEVVERYRFAVSTASPPATTRSRECSTKSPPGRRRRSRAPAVGSVLAPSSNVGGNEELTRSQQRIRSLLRRRIAVGVNECTRVLHACAAAAAARLVPADDSSASDPENCCGASPLLIVVAAEGMRPSPTIMVHLPLLARQLNVPLLLLPDDAGSGSASTTRRILGRLLGIRSASVVTFLSAPPAASSPPSMEGGAGRDGAAMDAPHGDDDDNDGDSDDDLRRANADLDSFLAFILGKVESPVPVRTR